MTLRRPPADVGARARPALDGADCYVDLDNVHVQFPVMTGNSRSLQLALYRALGRKGRPDAVPVVVHALRGVSLTITPGERVAFLGHNGAGKTTLLRTIAGAYSPTVGEVRVKGRVTAMTDFAMGMDPEATGRENIIFRGVFMGMRFREIEARVDEVIEHAGLREFIDLPMRTYSTGMFLRLAFSISTLETPDVLLLDEMINAGDIGFQDKLRKRIDQLLEDSKILVLATHDMAAVRQLCTRAIWMKGGKVHRDGPASEVADEYVAAHS